MIDLTTKTINKLFNQQIRHLTKKTNSIPIENSFDMQYSEWWDR